MVKVAPTKTYFLCKHCARTFATKALLKQHLPKHKPKIYKCPKCEHRTSWRVALKEHYRTQHTDNRPYLCPSTGDYFKTKAAAVGFEHRRYKSKSHKCKVAWCFQSYEKAEELEEHKKERHTNSNYVCRCGFSARTVPQMKYHKISRRHK